ncbi:adenosylcobinamide amidohydrolase [Paenibacillus protaetiae]|uniref:Adenosylcobinamide amidohydrolase n=1 Tax=Paenibacillus protaetiae TaxID=2509456 RepID=A0A4P6ERL2_9BACL|nr:adenosylcobinamide amidohydrolase [Paenibacillus protaetiae]QAY65690.1 hypothetical protein ET464_04125 [Paenibacillus protaetiae]
MSQPFRKGVIWNSQVWEGAVFRFWPDRIAAECPVMMRTLSNAVHLGGFAEADRIVNWKVPLTYSGGDPASETAGQLLGWGIAPDRTVGLLTAAKLTHASIEEMAGDRFAAVCCTTAGTRNAACAGSDRHTFSAYTPGTINTVLLIDGQLTDAAIINAVMTATEAKSAALRDLGIRDESNGKLATGTTTDALVIGVSGSGKHGAIHAYAGTATTLGDGIGRLVYRTVLEAAGTQHED